MAAMFVGRGEVDLMTCWDVTCHSGGRYILQTPAGIPDESEKNDSESSSHSGLIRLLLVVGLQLLGNRIGYQKSLPGNLVQELQFQKVENLQSTDLIGSSRKWVLNDPQ
ncbi:hypothetical protein Baya_5142 [Bagarius yarrelli]|uniref:Uncharacterized protein n=1 Tax=Bagarius yarrelli TaxID=175774 RepID=A0A556TTV0_BAGYA|nr:hypothetical protein Baya_5142 [Bagarius yarrelli]